MGDYDFAFVAMIIGIFAVLAWSDYKERKINLEKLKLIIEAKKQGINVKIVED